VKSSSTLKFVELITALRASSLFARLPEEDLTQVATFARQVSLKKGDYLFRENDPSKGFYIVRSGIINVHRIASNGREQVIHLFEAVSLLPRLL